MLTNSKYTYLKLIISQPLLSTITKRLMWSSLFKTVREKVVGLKNAARKAAVAEACERTPVPPKLNQTHTQTKELVDSKPDAMNNLSRSRTPSPIKELPIFISERANLKNAFAINKLLLLDTPQREAINQTNSTEKLEHQVSNLSGLLDPQKEWLSALGDIHPSVKLYLIIMYCKVIFIFMTFKIDSHEKFLTHINEFFKTSQDIFRELPDSKLFLHRYYSTLQHILIALVGEPDIEISLFKKCPWFQDLHLDHYIKGNALLAIECFVLSQTTKGSLYCFVMVNPDVPTQKKLPFTIEQSELATGQPNCDAFGIFADFNPQFALTYMYADVKMQFAGILNGRHSFKPELYSNHTSLKEYLTTIQTTIEQVIKKRSNETLVQYKDTTGILRDKILPSIEKNHPINQLFIDVKAHCKTIHEKVKKYTKDSKTKNFINKDEIEEIKISVQTLHDIIHKYMTNKQISEVLNIGLSTDYGIHEFFIQVYSKSVKSNLELHPTKISEIKSNILLSSTFEKSAYWEEVYKMVVFFPKEYVESFEEFKKALITLNISS